MKSSLETLSALPIKDLIALICALNLRLRPKDNVHKTFSDIAGGLKTSISLVTKEPSPKTTLVLFRVLVLSIRSALSVTCTHKEQLRLVRRELRHPCIASDIRETINIVQDESIEASIKSTPEPLLALAKETKMALIDSGLSVQGHSELLVSILTKLYIHAYKVGIDIDAEIKEDLVAYLAPYIYGPKGVDRLPIYIQKEYSVAAPTLCFAFKYAEADKRIYIKKTKKRSLLSFLWKKEK